MNRTPIKSGNPCEKTKFNTKKDLQSRVVRLKEDNAALELANKKQATTIEALEKIRQSLNEQIARCDV